MAEQKRRIWRGWWGRGGDGRRRWWLGMLRGGGVQSAVRCRDVDVLRGLSVLAEDAGDYIY